MNPGLPHVFSFKIKMYFCMLRPENLPPVEFMYLVCHVIVTAGDSCLCCAPCCACDLCPVLLKLLYWLMLRLLPGNLYPFSFRLSSSFNFMFCQILSNHNTTKSVIRMNQIFYLWFDELRFALDTSFAGDWVLDISHLVTRPPPPPQPQPPTPPAPDPSLSHLWLKRMVPSGWRRMRRLGTVTTWLYSFFDWEKKTSGSQMESTRR